MATDARSASRNYPVPHPDNLISEDFPRLITAVEMIDADVDDLFTQMGGKASASHGHVIGDVDGLQSALDGKAGDDHTHALGDLTDASTSGAGAGQYLGFNGSSWQPITIPISHVSGLQAALDGKSAVGHGHDIGDISGLQTALDGKADSVDRYFAKTDRNTVAWAKTGNGTAETSQAIWVEVSGVIRPIAAGTSITMPTLTAGTDYAIWVNPDGTLLADVSFSTPPTTGARQVGGFHYAPGGNAPAYDSGGNTTPQINEYSFWDLKFRPACPDPRGMTLVAGQFWCDIYLLNVNHHVNGTSKFNARIADDGDPPKIPEMFGGDGSATYSNANWWTMNEVLMAHGKRSLNYQEFAAAAYGVIEKTAGGTDPVDTILRKDWTSIWGVMLAAGNMYVWGRDFGRGGNSDSWSNNADGRGDTYALSRVALFGAPWTVGSGAGSRASSWSDVPSVSDSSIGARGRSDHLNHE